jgi:hypothetical protein
MECTVNREERLMMERQRTKEGAPFSAVWKDWE